MRSPGIEVFAAGCTFGKLAHKLLASYALDAVERCGGTEAPPQLVRYSVLSMPRGAFAVAVSTWPCWAVPPMVTNSDGVTSVTPGVAALVADVPPPSESNEVAMTRSWWSSFASVTR